MFEPSAGSSAANSPGPAPFVCAYLNGRADLVPPLLLALEGVDDVAALLAAAKGALQRAGYFDFDPAIVYTPDGDVIPKTARAKDLRPNCVLIISCGERFDRASVPERAKRIHAGVVAMTERLGPQVRAPTNQMLPDVPPPPASEMRRDEPAWRFSPSGKWGSGGLELRPHYRA